MFSVLLLTVLMATLSALFWCIEAVPFINALKKNNRKKGLFKAFRYAVGTVTALPKAIPLALDLACTIWLAGVFSLGGLFGTMIGITMSNVFSIFILFYVKKK